MKELPPLLFVSLAAVLAPVLASFSGPLRIPIVVFEIVLGVLMGPQGLGLAKFEGGLPYLRAPVQNEEAEWPSASDLEP